MKKLLRLAFLFIILLLMQKVFSQGSNVLLYGTSELSGDHLTA